MVGHKVAILAADGVDADGLMAMKTALMQAGVTVKVLSTHLGSLSGAGGAGAVPVDHLIATMPSVVFDGVVVAGGAASVAALKGSGEALQFVREAFKHAKPISALGDGANFLSTAGLVVAGAPRPAGVPAGADIGALATAFVADLSVHRHWDRANRDAVAA